MISETCVFLLLISLVRMLPLINEKENKSNFFRNLGSCELNNELSSKINFPWEVSIFRSNDDHKSTFVCGGSIINEQWILTAAHCFQKGEGEIKVIVGLDHADGITIKDYIQHEDFNPYLYDNDIALIKLSERLAFEENIQPIPLNENELPYGTNVTVSTWGFFCDDDPRTVGDSSPLTMILTTVDSKECGDIYGDLLPGAACSVLAGKNSNRSICNRNGGDPLIMNTSGKAVHVGLVSFGSTKGCNYGSFTVHMKTEHYINWIKEKIKF